VRERGGGRQWQWRGVGCSNHVVVKVVGVSAALRARFLRRRGGSQKHLVVLCVDIGAQGEELVIETKPAAPCRNVKRGSAALRWQRGGAEATEWAVAGDMKSQ
jgi:hypothetical protein